MRATAELTYIYLMMDYNTPYRNHEMDVRKKEALRATGLTETDVQDPLVVAAMKKYKEFLFNASRALRTLESMKQSLDKLDDYFTTVDFDAKDKKGELIHDTAKYLQNIERVAKAYAAIESFENRVMADLTKAASIQGKNASLGIREEEYAFHGTKKGWIEGSNPTMEVPEPEEEPELEEDDNEDPLIEL